MATFLDFEKPIAELEGQIESLKRQARQASRFKNLSADIRKAEATLLHLRWSAAQQFSLALASQLQVDDRNKVAGN